MPGANAAAGTSPAAHRVRSSRLKDLPMTYSLAPSELLVALGSLELLTPVQTQAVAGAAHSSAGDLLADLCARGWLTEFQWERVTAGEMTSLVLGPYRLLEPIGEGGMGQVFKARHPFMNRLVALKLIRPERLTHAEASARFHQEIQAAAQLAHPNIVRAYDAAQAGDLHYLAMELVEGIDLARVSLQRGPLPVAEACDYIRQAALGLQHAHEAGLVHRDLKPANLLLARDGTVKILDFGLARLVTPTLDSRDTSERADPHAGSLTQTGAMMGTPDYMAPEQTFDSHQVDIRADLYSLGCTLHQFLVGKPPFASHRTLTDKIRAHRRLPPDDRIEQVRPDAPQGLSMVLLALLAKAPEHRIGTPAQLAQALAPYCPGQRAVWQPPIPLAPSPPPAAPPSTVDGVPLGDTPMPGPTQPLPPMPGAPLPVAPLQPASPPRIEDKLAWLEQTHGAEEEQRRAQEIAVLASLMHQHLETAAWFPAYDTARALLKLEPTSDEAQKVVRHLGRKLRRRLILRVVARQAYQLFMGVGVGGMIIAPAVFTAWLAQWVQDGWQGWGATLLAYSLRVFTGGWLGGMTSVGLAGAVGQIITDQRSKLEKQITEALAVAGFVIGIGVWCLLPNAFSGWALGGAYGFMILAHALAPGGSPFVEQVKGKEPGDGEK